jgi:hypothetical protein
VTWGLVKRVCHQDDLMLVCCLANDLNSGLRLWLYAINNESAVIFSRTSRNRAVGACCTAKGPATGKSCGPPINRAARVGVDPILLSSSSRRSHFCRRCFPTVLRLPCFRARTPIHPLAPAGHALAPLLRAALRRACASRPCAALDPVQTLAVIWRQRRLPSWTRRRHGSGRR